MFKFLLLISCIMLSPPVWSHVHHLLKVEVDPENHFIKVFDEINLNKKENVIFQLNSNLKIHEIIGAVIINQAVNNGTREVTISPTSSKVFIEYSGIIFDPIVNQQSSGLISNNGIALFGSSLWYPHISKEFISFQMEVSLPIGWTSLSQGVSDKVGQIEFWSENLPQKVIYLMGEMALLLVYLLKNDLL